MARGRAVVPGDLDGAVLAVGGDDQLVAVERAQTRVSTSSWGT
jgi:hypothetical protein